MWMASYLLWIVKNASQSGNQGLWRRWQRTANKRGITHKWSSTERTHTFSMRTIDVLFCCCAVPTKALASVLTLVYCNLYSVCVFFHAFKCVCDNLVCFRFVVVVTWGPMLAKQHLKWHNPVLLHEDSGTWSSVCGLSVFKMSPSLLLLYFYGRIIDQTLGICFERVVFNIF